MNIERAQISWGDDIPDWVRVLAEACDQSSQKKVSAELNYSPTVINQLIGNKYPGDIEAAKMAVEGLLMSATVICPVLGEMKANICLEHQKAKFAPTNSTRVKLFKACHGNCKNSRIGRQP